MASDSQGQKEALRKDLATAEACFKQYDTNHSGFLEVNEVIKLLNDIFKKLGYEGTVTKAETLAIMKTLDLNHDIRLSMDEFLTIFQQYKKQLS